MKYTVKSTREMKQDVQNRSSKDLESRVIFFANNYDNMTLSAKVSFERELGDYAKLIGYPIDELNNYFNKFYKKG